MNICVLAGSLEQFSRWTHDNHKLIYRALQRGGGAVYGESIDRIMGYEFFEVVTTGTFWDRPDANSLYWAAKQRLRS
jgi:hypothetical protein